jgi:hypothetical protein
LLTIVSILDNIPLLHEPGFTRTHKDCERYNKIIRYTNFEFSINKIMLNKITNIKFYTDLFKEEIIYQFNKNKDDLTQIVHYWKDMPKEHVVTGIYNLNEKIDWSYINSGFKSIKSIKYKIEKGNK